MGRPCTAKPYRGFTLLELLVVLTIMAMATAGVALVLRDNADAALEREAQRLVALFESARAQSRASGVAVRWHTTPEGFRFEGLPPGSLPARWLTEGMGVRGNTSVQLGPEPIVGAQAVDLVNSQQPQRTLRIATNGLRPFAVQATDQP
ncbi:MAG: prepilin-type N-terminal cleavage/methylation domain-containing protein [Polaromonas sp.]|nr:prepilin-type N-terminal cleavage/methylation domain-containing protein [Polaromonas sp.]MDP2818747.1 prepilin-type N-terminal cleavage/methylation domain-containing protein [Polaromonas sp.]